MNTRNRVLLTSAVIMLSAPSAASAECPPQRHGDDETVIEVEITVQREGNLIGGPVLSDRVVSLEYPVGPAVKVDIHRDPANSMIQRIGLAEDPTG